MVDLKAEGTMGKFLIFMLAVCGSLTIWAQADMTVRGQGMDRFYCAENSGPLCLDQSKRRAESTAEREARWQCEGLRRGRSITYTIRRSTYCSPSSLPFSHPATWISCRSEVQMQCEIK